MWDLLKKILAQFHAGITQDYQLVNVMGIAHVQKIPQKIESVVIVVIKQGVTTAKFAIWGILVTQGTAARAKNADVMVRQNTVIQKLGIAIVLQRE